MTFRMHTPLIAVAALLALGPSLAMAQTTPRQEDRAQLNADLASLAVERAQLTTDTQARKADRVEGKMAAESRDALRVDHDRLAVQGEAMDIKADQPGSPQRRMDRADRMQEQAKLHVDEQQLKRDRRHGRMAATSPDGEKIYVDQQAIKGQEQAIADDTARVKADNARM
ncbi:MAG TPA: hypothetical protein PLK10_06720 [Ottowia sp.]|nr:hypothetical protein [Ottowia sp.]